MLILLITQRLPGMHTIKVQVLTLPKLLEIRPELTPLAGFFEQVGTTGGSLALEGDFSTQECEKSPLESQEGPYRDRSPGLLFALANVEPATLLRLASSMPAEYNENSGDLETSTTYLAWNADGQEVRVNTWHLRGFPGNMDTRRFLVAFVSGAHAVLSDHTLDSDAMDSLLSGLQGAQGSSGPNYQPSRIWSEDTMRAHEGVKNVLTAGVRTATVVRCTPSAGLSLLWN